MPRAKIMQRCFSLVKTREDLIVRILLCRQARKDFLSRFQRRECFSSLGQVFERRGSERAIAADPARQRNRNIISD